MLGDVVDWDAGLLFMQLCNYVMGIRSSKKGPAASAALGAPPATENPEQEAEGPREPEVITQEHQHVTTLSPSPASPPLPSLPSDSPSHSVGKEFDTGSVSEDTTTTTYSSCIEVATPSEETPPPYSAEGQTHESTDSEYESAEEVDLPPDPDLSHKLKPIIREIPASSEDNEAEGTRGEVNDIAALLAEQKELRDIQPGEDINIQKECILSQVTEIPDTHADTSVTCDAIDVTDGQQPPVTLDKASDCVPQKQSESLPSIISDSLVTVTKSEIIEESVSEKEILINETVTISPNDIQLFEKVSVVVPPENQCIDNTPDVEKLTDAYKTSVRVLQHSSETQVGEISSQNSSVGKVEESRLELNPDEHSQVCCENLGDIQPDPPLAKETEESDSPCDPPIINSPSERPEPPEEIQSAGDKEESWVKGVVALGDTSQPHSLSEARSEEEQQAPQHSEDPGNIPISASKGYNLDFLDALEDPNFNPFATKVAIHNTPPPSPDPARKLPPLKPTIRKKDSKDNKTTTSNSGGKTHVDVGIEQEKHTESHKQPDTNSLEEHTQVSGREVSPAVDNATNNNTERGVQAVEAGETLELAFDDPIKPPRKLGGKPNLKSRRKPVKKDPPDPQIIEKNNNTVERDSVCDKEIESESEELPLPPSKGYNLDFLDNLDDPNFNPFSTQTAVRNSPPIEGFTTTDKEEELKAKVVTAKKSPERKGLVAIKNKAKLPDLDNKLEEKTQVSETSSEKQGDTNSILCPEGEEDEVVPTKNYNLDFLDDPNFNPFQTLSAYTQQNTASPNPSVVPQEDSASAGKEQNTVTAEEDGNLEPDVSKNTDIVKDRVIQQNIQQQRNTTEESSSETDFDKQVASESNQGEREKSDFKTEESHDVNDNSQVHLEKSYDVEQAKKSGDKLVEKEIESVEAISSDNLPEQDKINVVGTRQPKLQLTLDSESKENTALRNFSVIPGTDDNTHKLPSIGTIGQLDSLEFDQLLGHEASRLAQEFMNCSTDSGLPDSDESTPVKSVSSVMADTSCANTNLDENVNPFQKSSRLSRSPPLGKRGAVCGAESSDASSRSDPFMARRLLKRESVLGEERMETGSLDDDSGIVLGSRSDLETDANHSEAGPEIATGLTPSDLRCASQLQEEDQEEEFSDHITDEEFLASEAFFKDATDLENQLRKTLISPLLGSHSKLSSSEEGTPTKERKDPLQSVTPESPQNKPVPSTSSPARPTSSPAPPPREERSAPEGTSSPTPPRPTDTSERKLSSARPTSAPPEGYMTATEVQELLKRQELKFEEKLLQVELAAGEKEKKLHQAMKDEQKELSTLGSSVSELTQSRDALLKMVGQYKGMLASLVSEKEKDKVAAEEKIKTLETERNQALEDLANVEVAFSDVHRKYERTKQVVDTLRRNEDTLRGAVADYEAKLQKHEQKFIEFQKHAEEKIQLANEEFESMRKGNEQEMTKMAALLKKAEMKIMSLQDAHDRKTRENQELTQLCDDLINKVGK